MQFPCLLSAVFLIAELSSLAIGSVGTASNALVTTPYAVPVGVPVASHAPAYYSLQALGNSNSTSMSREQEEQLVKKIADRVARKLIGSPSMNQQTTQALPEVNIAQSILQARCIHCHNQTKTKGDLNLEMPISKLTRAIRQQAILRMISSDPSRRMPKGQPPLSEEEFLALFYSMVQ